MANTTQGKAVSARNATTHGLFCRQTVLPHLGESPDAYKALLDALLAELPPQNMMEHQYLELWAEASWKLRRLSRWEAQVWEEDALGDDQRLAKIERLARLQTTLRRQLDKCVRMLGQDVPALYHDRLRREVLTDLSMSEADCRRDKHLSSIAAKIISAERETQIEDSQERLAALNRAALDTAQNKYCRNELPPTEPAQNCQNELDEENCQNEPAPAPSLPAPPKVNDVWDVGASPDLRDVQTFTVRGVAPPPPAPAFRQFARACAKRE